MKSFAFKVLVSGEKFSEEFFVLKFKAMLLKKSLQSFYFTKFAFWGAFGKLQISGWFFSKFII